jgi:hypothetical protein
VAIVTVKRIPEGDSSSQTLDSEKGIVRKYTVQYQVLTNDLDDDSLTVLSSGSLPAMAASYSVSDLGAIVIQRDANRDASQPLLWNVTINYASDGINLPLAPWEREVKWSVITKTADTALQYDVRGEDFPLINSAGDPYLPPVSVPRGTMVFRAEWAVLGEEIDIEWYRAFLDKVNNPEFTAFPCPTAYPDFSVLVESIEASQDELDGSPFWKLTCQLALKLEEVVSDWDEEEGTYTYTTIGGWRPSKILDQGFNEKIGTRRIPILETGSSNPKSTPTLLDGAGAKLAVDGDPVFNDAYLFSVADLNTIFTGP